MPGDTAHGGRGVPRLIPQHLVGVFNVAEAAGVKSFAAPGGGFFAVGGASEVWGQALRWLVG